MPIRPENRELYPKNWKKEIVPAVKERAKNRCEWCGVRNHAVGYRDECGKFWEEDGERFIPDKAMKRRSIKIVCTVAHLDHDPTNNDPGTLAFLCQKCHNGYDAKHRAAGIRQRKDRAMGQETLLAVEVVSDE